MYNWTVNNIKNYEKFCYEKITKKQFDNKQRSIVDLPRFEENGKYYQMTSKTNAILWGLLAIGINDITQKNFEKVYNRFKIREAFQGTMYYNEIPPNLQIGGITRKPLYTTKQDIIDHIGLSTNATTQTKAQFMKNLKLEL